MEPLGQLISHLTSFWMGLGILLIFLEVVTPLFGFILIGGSALLAGAGAAYGFSLGIQLAIFVVCLILSLALVRPRILAKINATHHIQERTEALIGKSGRVSEVIDPTSGGLGRVIIDGEDWAALSGEKISIDQEIKVKGSDGIILKVEKL